jgi:hypothetical protein
MMDGQISEEDIRLLLQELMAKESPKKTYGVDGVERAMTEQEMDDAVNSGAITQDKSTYNIDGAERAMTPGDYDAAVSSGAITQDIAQPQPTNREFDAPPLGLGNDRTAPISNMSPAETHSMGIDPDTGEEIIHPGRDHQKYLEMMRAFGFPSGSRY